MAMEHAGDGTEADALNELWDALVRPGREGGQVVLVAPVDPGLGDALLRFRDRDDAPAPAPGFAAGLWSSLLLPPQPTPIDQVRYRLPVPRRPLVRAARSRRPLVELAAAAILVVTFAGGMADGVLPPPFAAGSPTALAQAADPIVDPGCPSLSTPVPGRVVGAPDLVPPPAQLDAHATSADRCAGVLRN